MTNKCYVIFCRISAIAVSITLVSVWRKLIKFQIQLDLEISRYFLSFNVYSPMDGDVILYFSRFPWQLYLSIHGMQYHYSWYSIRLWHRLVLIRDECIILKSCCVMFLTIFVIAILGMYFDNYKVKFHKIFTC